MKNPIFWEILWCKLYFGATFKNSFKNVRNIIWTYLWISFNYFFFFCYTQYDSLTCNCELTYYNLLTFFLMKFGNINDQTELFFSIFDNLMVQAVLWNDLSFLFKNVLNIDILIGLFKVYLLLLHIIWFFDYFMVQTTLRCENILSFYEILKYEFMRALWTIFFVCHEKSHSLTSLMV